MTYKLIDYERLKAFSESLKSKYVTKNDLPKKLSDMQEDTTHRLTTDAEKENWNNKVDNREGYGLSKNDYNDEEKTKVNSSIKQIAFKNMAKRDIAELWCTNNAGDVVKVNLPMAYGYNAGLMSFQDKSKLDSVDIGANKITNLSELTNDTNFKTESEIQSMIEKASSLKKEVVTSLPTTGKDDVIYLVKDAKGKDNNNYLEYLWLNGKYELIGSTQVDLSGYATKEEKNKLEQSIRDDMVGFQDYVKEQISTMLDKEKDKAVIDQHTDYSNNTLYTTPYFVQQAIGVQLTKQIGYVAEDFEEKLSKKLNTSDIQEFTQQELEEAFK